jgi:hypothetical protein
MRQWREMVLRSLWCAFLLILVSAAGVLAQPPAGSVPATGETEEAEASGPSAAAAATAAGEAAAVENRTSLNLLGQANTGRGESRRNENVQITLIDNNAARELNARVGTTATVVEEYQPDRGYFSAELGNAPRTNIHVGGQAGNATHGTLYWTHQNSLFSARSFFQVGSVKPARQNSYGLTVGTGLWRNGYLTVNSSQQKNRGQVNGNILIPLQSERTPLVADPALRARVLQIFNAFPNVLPNRTDIAARALNTNSPQSINIDNHTGQITQKVGAKDTFVWRYVFTGQRVDAFQFVVGQNPNTFTKSHAPRMGWHRVVSARTLVDATVAVDRTTTQLVPAKEAVGPVFVQGLTNLGPPINAPLNRVQNRFRGSVSVQSTQGRHVLSAGMGITRLQYNSDEAEATRGIFQFFPDTDTDPITGQESVVDGITRLRQARSNRFITSIGTAYRAYRNWDLSGYLGDRWQAASTLTLNFALRWDPTTRPIDVTRRSVLKFDSDWNNFSGSFGFAKKLAGKWGVVRGAGGAMYGQIFPVTYGADRYNVPFNSRVIVQAPANLLDPLAGVDQTVGPNTRSSRFLVSPNLATPYQYQYNLSWERDLAPGWHLQLGYAGSRSHKLFFTYLLNRAQFVEGIKFNTATVSDRRPDKTAFEVLDMHNGSRAYYDAAIVKLTVPRWHGISLNTSYWFSKAIDLGSDYTSTAAGNTSRDAAGQNGIAVHQDQKALSDFHQPHALLVQAGYDTRGGVRRLGVLSRNWTLSTVVLAKTGTPFTVSAGSDGPGFGNVDGLQGDRVVLLDASVLGRTVGDPDTSRQLLPKPAFRFITAPAETTGNIGRNVFRKGKIANVNASIERAFVLPHEWQLAFRAESINFFNTPQFSEPGPDLSSPNFALITNTLNDGRTFRFTLRFGF